MLITEMKAKEKWCPHTSDGSQCVASNCMAWRWGQDPMEMRAFKDEAPEGWTLTTMRKAALSAIACALETLARLLRYAHDAADRAARRAWLGSL